MRIILTFLILLILTVTSCVEVVVGSGVVVVEERDVRGYSGVYMADIGELSLDQNGKEGLTISAEDNVMPYIVSAIEGKDVLKIAIEPPYPFISFEPSRPLRYDLDFSNPVEVIRLAGSGALISASIESDDLEIDISASGEVTIDSLTANSVECTLAAGGECNLSGVVTSQTLVLSGAGIVNNGNLQSSNADVSLSSSGTVTIWVQDSLNVKISGSGTVNYYGSPRITQDLSGGGSIVHLGDK